MQSPVQYVTCMKSTQVGLTEVANNWLLSVAHKNPGPCLMVLPTVELAKAHSRSKITPSLREMPFFDDIIHEAKSRESGNTMLLKEFTGGFWRFGGANSGATFRSASIKYLILDDVDGYPMDVDGEGDPIDLAKKRTDSFMASAKILIISTPTTAGVSKVEQEWKESDQSHYHIKCPLCGTYQPLEWGGPSVEYGIKWEKKDGKHLPKTAAYMCKVCHGLIPEHQKTVMLAEGKWVATHPDRSDFHRGFHLSSLYSPLGWVSWAQIVREFLKAKRHPEKLKVWVNTRLGLPFEDKKSSVEWKKLRARVEPYKPFSLPQGARVITTGVDVQANRLAVAVKGWGREMESWLVWWGELWGDPGTKELWAQLDDLLRRTYLTADGIQISALCCAVDSGDNTQTVYNYVRTRSPLVMAIKGQSVQGKPVVGRPTYQDVDYAGTVIKGGVLLWPVGADTAKTLIYTRLNMEKTGPGYIHFYDGLPDDYFRGLVAEKKRTKYIKGYPREEWVLPSGERNEPLDCEVYALAAAMRVGLDRIRWDKVHTISAQATKMPGKQPSPAHKTHSKYLNRG